MSKLINTLSVRQNFNVDQYLDRLGVDQPLSVDLATLTRLQLAHLKTIPFENLDIQCARPISLDLDDLFQKIVTNNRGGFCYELNGLFYVLLQALGFDTKMVSARSAKTGGGFAPEYDHLAIVVSIGDKAFLTDVGFGRFAIAPILIQPGARASDGAADFQIEQIEVGSLLVSRIRDKTLVPEYRFTLAARNLSEFQDMCEFHQTSPDSHFTRKKVISILTDDGRMTLTDKQFKISTRLDSEIKYFQADEFEGCLERYFDIRM